MKGLFVTGTDTGIGKTVAAAALMHLYRARAPVCYWKAIQTGIEIDDDTDTVRRLGACSDVEILGQGVRLLKPVSPHLAARWAGKRIDLMELRQVLPSADASWVIEGAGGVLTPINESQTMVDWIVCLALPALVVARSGLGTINHTLLTLAALRTRGVRIAGVLMVGQRNPDNRAAIEQYGEVPVVGEMPVLTPLNPGALAAWSLVNMDRNSLLQEFLR